MKKKSVRLLAMAMTVALLMSVFGNALALISVGSYEFDKPPGCQNTKKITIHATYSMSRMLQAVTQWAYFNGQNALTVSYSQEGSGTHSINGGVEAQIFSYFSLEFGYQYSWTAGEVQGYSYLIESGSRVGYYRMEYRKGFYAQPFTTYTRTSTIFETGPWVIYATGTIHEETSSEPYFYLAYSSST